MSGLTVKDFEEQIKKLRDANARGPFCLILTPKEYEERAKDVNFGRVEKIKYFGIDVILAEVDPVIKEK